MCRAGGTRLLRLLGLAKWPKAPNKEHKFLDATLVKAYATDFCGVNTYVL
jgi:hypothetical protein